MKKPNTTGIDAYIQSFDGETRHRLLSMLEIIRRHAPESVESMSYGMPAFKTNGKPLVYFAGYDKHIGFYATPTGHEAFAGDLAGYKQGKGSVQFPHDQPLPIELIGRMVAFRVQENAAKLKK